MPNSNESSESEFSNENQQNIINRNTSLVRSGSKTLINGTRHQQYSKNVYIGTRNAEKWENIRSNLAFKNDVEFVSYLLSLAEKEQQKNVGIIPNKPDDLPIVLTKPLNTSRPVSPTELIIPPKKIKKVKFHEPTELEVDSQPTPEKKKSRRSSSRNKKAHDGDLNFRKKIIPPPESLVELKTDNILSDNAEEVLDCRIEEKRKSDFLEQQIRQDSLRDSAIESAPYPIIEEALDKNVDEENAEILCLAMKKLDEIPSNPKTTEELEHFPKKRRRRGEPKAKKGENRSRNKNNKHDIRKAPMDAKIVPSQDEIIGNEFEEHIRHPLENIVVTEKLTMNHDTASEDDDVDDDSSNCRDCNTKHNKNDCQIRDPIDFIDDPVKYSDWLEDNKHLLEEDKPSFDHLQIKSEDLEEDEENDDNDDDIENDDSNETSSNISATDFAQNFATVKKNVEHTEIVPSFSEVSLPSQFELMLNDDLGIVTKLFLPKFTQLGPLIGETISEIDIADDCNMKLIFETFDGIKSNFLSAENKNKSNWLRYMRPASTRDLRNATLIFKDNHIYFITCNDIEAGCELLYWSDENNSAWDKKKIDRLNCGGCNIKFDHPLYYRTHCSVFHDSTFSLTIRKYHCKICGIAVLGKENIMKHAAQMHEGKGAYQCQYCKKFFLRLNYLEMHRTYGCSANPQRARPLCDFCGRKFCQPQKLKVHIKRMHSDMAEVLRDFQCKLCSKLLGSRAALQRHSKEVHSRNSTVVSCPRCQKLFQNRSNLKIHMLTHSGVRPFKCIETECNAAFTTKQCLQFHYKKVHGYTQDQMPKIERSVAYTFDAYSGGIKVDMSAEQASRRRRRSLDYDSSLANETEENEMNKFAMPNKGANDLLKQHQASMSEICKNETNLSLFSTTISSFLNQEIHRDNLDRDVSDVSDDDIEDDGIDSQVDEDEAHPDETDYVAEKEMHNSVGHIKPPQIETHQQNAQLSLVESFLSETSSRLNLENHDELSMMSAASNNNIEKDHDNYRINETMCNVGPNTHQNLVASKGSKKWINTELNDASDMSVNRDFLSKLIMSGNNQCDDNDDDDNSTILDVVETNQNQYNSPSLGIDTADTMQQIQHIAASPQLHHHQSNLVSGFYNNNRQIGSISTSASMLVEAALNSVSNMIDNENDVKNCASNTSEDNNISSLNISHNNSNVDHHMAHVDFENTRNYNQSSYIQSPIPNNLILKEANNDIDVDSVSTPNENFPHHATPSPRAISPGQDYPLNMYSATTSNSHHHVALENCRRGYSMMQENHIEGSDSPQSLPRYDFSGIPRRKSDGSHQISHLSSDDENSIIVAQNLSINNNQDEMKVKMPHAQQLDLLYSKYNNEGQGNLSHEENVNNLTENRMKYSNNSNHAEQNGMDIAEFRSNSSNETISDFQGVDMSSRSLIGGYHNSSSFQIPTSGVNLSINRYHHQIYDILSDRDQQTNDQHQLQQQQMQHIMQDQINDDPPDQSTSVDLSRSGNYSVSSPPPPPPPLPYSHPHSDMLRMVSLDLTPNSGAGMLSHSHLRHSTSLLSSHQMQHNPRDSLSVEAHNRLISTEQLTSNHRLIVDPTTHLLMEQNNRILSENNRSILDQTSRLLVDPTANRHMVPSRGFGAYHHQVATSNFHHSTRGGLPSPHSGNPSNYHPFSAYY